MQKITDIVIDERTRRPEAKRLFRLVTAIQELPPYGGWIAKQGSRNIIHTTLRTMYMYVYIYIFMI
jgi:hypothetical protein